MLRVTFARASGTGGHASAYLPCLVMIISV